MTQTATTTVVVVVVHLTLRHTFAADDNNKMMMMWWTIPTLKFTLTAFLDGYAKVFRKQRSTGAPASHISNQLCNSAL